MRAGALLAAGRRLLKRASFRVFLALDRAGIHVLPRHYYSAIPDFGWLRRNLEAWTGRNRMTGVEWNLDAQLDWVRETCRGRYGEVAGLESYSELARAGIGPGYGPIESQVLHCFIRREAPAQIVEVGSGVSTVVMLNAIAMNESGGGRRSSMMCVEPHPGRVLLKEKRVTLVREHCQKAAPEVFERLTAGDLLFIDSSHAVKTGSDVLKLYLDVVPRLPEGVFIHAHDIYLPYLYPRRALAEYLAGQETALVLALLTGNPRLKVLAGLAALHYDRTSGLKEILTDYSPQGNREGLAASPEGHFPSSLWMVTGPANGGRR